MAAAIGAISQGVTAGAELGIGIYQFYKGKKLERNNARPTYNIPQSIKDKMSTAELMQYQGLPEEQKQNYIDNLSRSTTFALNQLGTRKAGLGGISSLTQQGNDANKNLLAMDASQRNQNIQNLQNARSEQAGYEDQMFSFNKAQPYYEKANQAQALKGAGMQNVMKGIGGLGGAGTNFAVNKSGGAPSENQLPGGGA